MVAIEWPQNVSKIPVGVGADVPDYLASRSVRLEGAGIRLCGIDVLAIPGCEDGPVLRADNSACAIGNLCNGRERLSEVVFPGSTVTIIPIIDIIGISVCAASRGS
jgi:hypothetical protein